MSVKLRASSGSYNVRASELASHVLRPNVARTVKCTVHFLDDTEATFEIDKRAKAQQLLDKVYEHLELIERDYFGLQFVDVGPNAEGMQQSSYPTNSSHPLPQSQQLPIISQHQPPSQISLPNEALIQHTNKPNQISPPPPPPSQVSPPLPQISPPSSNNSANSDIFIQPLITSDVMRWLDPLKTLKKQLRVGPPYILYFRVKFYVSDPSKLQEEYTRYHFFLQVKKDIAEGKLVVPYKTAVLLASYAVQSELGDFHPDEHVPGYLAEFRFVPNITEEFENEVCEMHKQHKGQTPADAEYFYLDRAKWVDTYGVDLQRATDQSDIEIQLGVTSVGLVVFQKNVRINTFSWAKIVKISFKRKQFFIQLRKEVNDNVENLIGFNMVSYRSCKNLWKSCVEHHTFFRLHSPPQQKSSIFSLGSKFRYSEKESSPDDESNGRTEFQTLEDSKRRARIERTFTRLMSLAKSKTRSPSKRYARRTVGATTRDAIMTERNAIDGYSNTPHSTSVDSFPTYPAGDPMGGRGSRGTSPQKQYPSTHIPNSSSYPLAFPNSRNSGGNTASGAATTGNGSAIYNNNNSSSLTNYHNQHASNNLSSNSNLTAATTSPQHSVNNSLSSQSQNSFQHTLVRSTLPNDYKPNNYTVKNQPPQNGGWVTPQPTSSNVTSRTVTPQPSQLHQLNTSDSSRLSRSFDSRSLDRKEQRKSRGFNNNNDNVSSNTTNTNYGIASSQTSDTRIGGSVDQRVTSPSRQQNTTTGITNGNKSKRDFDESGGFRDHQQRQRHLQSKKKNATSTELYAPSIPPKLINSMDETASTLTDQSYELPAYNEYPVPNGNAYSTDGHGLVTIKMKPDPQGRFGFNVKGGKDQGMPIIVSRVAPGTPADICIPRLNEGDQVLFINGRDVSQHNHEQVVMFIRASRETHSGELVLVVRPNVYIGDETADNEPDFQYIPDTHHISTTLPPGGNALDASLLLLQEGLESGAALAQFEQLYRKKPGLTMNAARMDLNLQKNRYRDISPYDQTRVKIKTQGGDYINANFVNMEIPGSGIINRYIAAQGPLPNTSSDFWEMVWEQHCTLVVMLTTNVERGRVKCHQYWPQLYETAEFGNLQVACLKEENTQSFAFREFTLVNKNDKKEERHITQMQYISWPDHGVPDDSTDFLDFVTKVRQRRSGMTEPTIVHCSAGIGRTGVLITMETAMCLIESNQPVYPLDIVRQMRDQRAMLIQTSSQYKFVCEAITKVHSDKIVEPLEEYR